jgi:long-chain acyl-CoA synthetase
VHALAKGFIAAGVQAGDRVALMSHTRYEWTLIDYALWTAGAVVVPIYETSSAEQVEWILSDSGARALVVETAAHLKTAAQTLAAAPQVQRVWQIEDAAGEPPPAGPGGAAGRPDHGRR